MRIARMQEYNAQRTVALPVVVITVSVLQYVTAYRVEPGRVRLLWEAVVTSITATILPNVAVLGVASVAVVRLWRSIVVRDERRVSIMGKRVSSIASLTGLAVLWLSTCAAWCQDMTLDAIIDGAQYNWSLINDLKIVYVFDQYYAYVPNPDGTKSGELRNSYRFTYLLKKPSGIRLERYFVSASDSVGKCYDNISTFNGETGSRFYPGLSAAVLEPRNPDVREMNITCFGLSVEGKPLGIFVGDIIGGRVVGKTCELTGHDVSNGTENYIVTIYSNGKLEKKIWIAPDAGYCYRRVEKYDPESGAIRTVIDRIELQQVGEAWVPLRGRNVLYEEGVPGKIIREVNMTVEQVAVNSNLPDSLFEPDFPSGTRVYDPLLGTSYVVP
jgi:hypothetical protein